MGRIARVVLPGYPHHVTQRGVRSLDMFGGDTDFLAEVERLTKRVLRPHRPGRPPIPQARKGK